ncbi:MAG: YkgJ family cysteine cluster protein [Methanothrix sp.]|jgi:Fe-S-cluster containining protein|nr:YkgJ family cysteine cluster protein [Methanothrix sp.]
MEEIDRGIRAMLALQRLVPEGGLKNLEKVREEMDDLISPEFEPYFLANAALHLLVVCERCGRCCLEEKGIAVSIDDCRRIARHQGLSLKRFMMDCTRPHELKGDLVGSARMLGKKEGEPCPFFDSGLPGCRIYSIKPQVCTAALYLTKMNLITCEEQKEINDFPICSADAKLRARVADFASRLDEDAKREIVRLFDSTTPEVKLFRLLLRLKGMEIYFGQERATLLARRLGLARVPRNEEMRGAAILYAVRLLADGWRIRVIIKLRAATPP